MDIDRNLKCSISVSFVLSVTLGCTEFTYDHKSQQTHNLRCVGGRTHTAVSVDTSTSCILAGVQETQAALKGGTDWPAASPRGIRSRHGCRAHPQEQGADSVHAGNVGAEDAGAAV